MEDPSSSSLGAHAAATAAPDEAARQQQQLHEARERLALLSLRGREGLRETLKLQYGAMHHEAEACARLFASAEEVRVGCMGLGRARRRV